MSKDMRFMVDMTKPPVRVTRHDSEVVAAIGQSNSIVTAAALALAIKHDEPKFREVLLAVADRSVQIEQFVIDSVIESVELVEWYRTHGSRRHVRRASEMIKEGEIDRAVRYITREMASVPLLLHVIDDNVEVVKRD